MYRASIAVFSFVHDGSYYPCALIHWFVPVSNCVDDETGLWVVKPEFTANGQRHLAVVHLDCIARAIILVQFLAHPFFLMISIFLSHLMSSIDIL